MDYVLKNVLEFLYSRESDWQFVSEQEDGSELWGRPVLNEKYSACLTLTKNGRSEEHTSELQSRI